MKIIWPSHSHYRSPCILVLDPPEKGKPQPPRLLLTIVVSTVLPWVMATPFPLCPTLWMPLLGEIVCKLDLASCYWQVPVKSNHVHKTPFATNLGLYKFLCMPYGLKTAPQTFQHILNTVFSEFLYQWLIIYIDDCIIGLPSSKRLSHSVTEFWQLLQSLGCSLNLPNVISFLTIWRF